LTHASKRIGTRVLSVTILDPRFIPVGGPGVSRNRPVTAVTPAAALAAGVTGATRYLLYVPKSYSSSGMAAPVAAGLCPKGFLVTPSPLPS
jgi:hypothetical protein